MPSASGLGAGGTDGVGGPVVLAGLPHDRVAVVLAAVVDDHPHSQGQGGFAATHRLAAVVAVLAGGDPGVGIEPVEGLLGVADCDPIEIGMAVAELIAEAGVVVR
jgi:hypothetical protein